MLIKSTQGKADCLSTSSFSIVGSRTQIHGEDFDVYVINKNTKESKAKLELNFDGQTYGDIEKRIIDLDFDEKKFTFKVSVSTKVMTLNRSGIMSFSSPNDAITKLRTTR